MQEAGLLRNKNVITKNHKKVGIVQNVLFEADPKNPLAFILIFLTEKNWLRKHIEENWGRIGIETLATLLPDQANKILKDAKEKGEKEAKNFWGAYLKDNADKAQLLLKKCYLLPSTQIENSPSKDELKLKTEDKDMEDYGSIGIPRFVQDSEVMFALYGTSNLPTRDQLCMLPITLNKTPVHQKTVSDFNHDKGLISDIQLDPRKGQVANFIIDVMGENSGKRIVPFSDVNLDSQKLKQNKTFKAYPCL
jgi:sporulation protein YlmC with PRC-barrel domain